MTTRVQIAEIVTLNPRLPGVVAHQPDREVDFVPMAQLGEDGRITCNQTKRLGDVVRGYTYFENGDVIVAKITPCMENGKAAYVRNLPHGIAFGSTEFHVLRPSTRIDPAYLFYMVWNPWFRHEAARNMTGTAGQQRVPAKFVERFEIPLPANNEQQRITRILDKADAIRRKRRLASNLITDLSNSLFEDLFGRWLSHNGVDTFVPVSSFVERFQSGLNLATPDKPSADTKYFILKVSAATWNEYRPWEAKPVFAGYEPPTEHFVKKGDLLISRANTSELVGATVYVHETPQDRILPDKLWRFVWRDPEQVEPLFVLALMNHPKIRSEIGKRASGTSGSMKNISMEKVLSLRVPWPPLELQRKYARSIGKINEIRNGQANQAGAVQVCFESLVQRAFRGEL